jgi:hypothetical protein
MGIKWGEDSREGIRKEVGRGEGDRERKRGLEKEMGERELEGN